MTRRGLDRFTRTQRALWETRGCEITDVRFHGDTAILYLAPEDDTGPVELHLEAHADDGPLLDAWTVS
jgi:hypothetical protein